ncbi:hypothetical protein J22TS1_20720 [Siminovitchia terrae]|uniref:hypothetical protein n=1 Tax=Siminovitchia terrae TaxID=1914933 RepID=UPI001B10D103|nr:hypothetical protein [Siminovitchia terrae]GIN91021.1 hypothetical protein J22TS1_20720 [Siminovitchia terrae]
MNAYWYSIQWGFKPRLNKVKASGVCHRFSKEIYRARHDKIWAQIRQGAFDLKHRYPPFSIVNTKVRSRAVPDGEPT